MTNKYEIGMVVKIDNHKDYWNYWAVILEIRANDKLLVYVDGCSHDGFDGTLINQQDVKIKIGTLNKDIYGFYKDNDNRHKTEVKPLIRKVMQKQRFKKYFN